jgi:integrase/recombinase XerD
MSQTSPLRRRMIGNMTVRDLSPATQRSYISAVAKFSCYFGRSPDRFDPDDVHAFQVHLVSIGISWRGSTRSFVPCAASTASRL